MQQYKFSCLILPLPDISQVEGLTQALNTELGFGLQWQEASKWIDWPAFPTLNNVWQRKTKQVPSGSNGSNMHSVEIHRFSVTFPSSQGTSSEMGQPQAARHCANTLSLHQGQLFQRKTLSLQAHVVGRGIKHNYTGLHNRFKPVETKIGAYSILNTWV